MRALSGHKKNIIRKKIKQHNCQIAARQNKENNKSKEVCCMRILQVIQNVRIRNLVEFSNVSIENRLEKQA